VTKRRAKGIILILTGACIILLSLPFTSNFDRRDSIVLNVIRNFVTGEIILRESVLELVPDRDEGLYREFQEYISQHAGMKEVSEDEALKEFYEARYRDKIFYNEFRLKMKKNKIVTHKTKIAIPYKYVSLPGFFLFLIGMWVVLRKSKKSEGT
jgi:hypothetical protein